MKPNIQNILILSKKDTNQIYTQIDKSKLQKNLSNLEITQFYYPIDTNLDNTNFKFIPYEDYAEEVEQGSRTTYSEISVYHNKIFGLLIALSIGIIFAIFDIRLLISVESLVSMLAAYTIGKELWLDISNFLTDSTLYQRVKFLPQMYFYRKQDFGTIQRYWKQARKERSGADIVLADQMDYITHSLSKTLELKYEYKSIFRKYLEEKLLISILESVNCSADDLLNKGILGYKVTIQRNFTLFKRNEEYFQVIDKGQVGAIVRKNSWKNNATFKRTTYIIFGLKYYSSMQTLDNTDLISII